jgi:hypothetical protein
MMSREHPEYQKSLDEWKEIKKVYVREQKRAWNLNNPDKVAIGRAKERERRREDKDIINAEKRKENRVKRDTEKKRLSELSAPERRAELEKKKTKNKDFYNKNKERIKEQGKIWRKNNPDKDAAIAARSRKKHYQKYANMKNMLVELMTHFYPKDIKMLKDKVMVELLSNKINLTKMKTISSFTCFYNV